MITSHEGQAARSIASIVSWQVALPALNTSIFRLAAISVLPYVSAQSQLGRVLINEAMPQIRLCLGRMERVKSGALAPREQVRQRMRSLRPIVEEWRRPAKPAHAPADHP